MAQTAAFARLADDSSVPIESDEIEVRFHDGCKIGIDVQRALNGNSILIASEGGLVIRPRAGNVLQVSLEGDSPIRSGNDTGAFFTGDGRKVPGESDTVEVQFTDGRVLAIKLGDSRDSRSIVMLCGGIAAGRDESPGMLAVRAGAANVIHVSLEGAYPIGDEPRRAPEGGVECL